MTIYTAVNLVLLVLAVTGFTLASWGTFASLSPGVYAATPRWVRWVSCRRPLFRRLDVTEGKRKAMATQSYIWTILACLTLIQLAVFVSGMK